MKAKTFPTTRFVTRRSKKLFGLRYVIRRHDRYVNLTVLARYLAKAQSKQPFNIVGNWRRKSKTRKLIDAISEDIGRAAIGVDDTIHPASTFAHPTLALEFAATITDDARDELRWILESIPEAGDDRRFGGVSTTVSENETTEDEEKDAPLAGPSAEPDPPSAQEEDRALSNASLSANRSATEKREIGTQTEPMDCRAACEQFVPGLLYPMDTKKNYVVIDTNWLRDWCRDQLELKREVRELQSTAKRERPVAPTREEKRFKRQCT